MITLNTNIITLDKKKITNKIEQYKKLDPIVVNGFNGSNLHKNINPYEIKYFNYNYMPYSVIGCAISHIKCWKKHILLSNNYTLILEDDFFINNDALLRLKNIFKINNLNKIIEILIHLTPKDFDILYLGYISGSIIKNYFKLTNNSLPQKNINEFIEIPNISLGLHSYIVSTKGVIKLLNYIKNNKINFHIDYYIQKLASNNKLITYSLKERLFYQTSTCKINPIANFITTNLKFPLLNNLYLDEYVSVNYLFNILLFRIYNIEFTLWLIFLFIIILIILIQLIKKKLINNSK